MLRAIAYAAIALFLVALCDGGPPAYAADQAPLKRDDYNWRSLAMGGGGYVLGLVAHPNEPNLIYIRTDVGGAYRFSATPDALGRSWIPLSEAFTADQWNYYGVESLALDPNDPDTVYMAAGKYAWAGKGRVFVSHDRGANWSPLPLETVMASNGENRHTGERLAVDPFNSQRIYFGSRTEGLFVSEDAGQSWHASGALPATPDNGTGISFVQVDPYHRLAKGAPARIYIGIWGIGVAKSDDGGATWSLLGGVVHPAHAAVSRDGVLVVAGNDGVYLYDKEKWSDITPAKGKTFGGVSIDPFRPDTIAAAEVAGQHQLPIYISSDRGQTWKALTSANGSVTHKADIPWLPGFFFASGTSSLTFDPKIKDRLWFTDWYATWFTTNYRAPVPHFVAQERGHEEMVVMTMVSPSQGAWLLSGTVDTNGFRHTSTDLYPESAFNTGGLWQTFGLDFHESDPNRIIRVGTIGGHGENVQGGVTVSSDNGRTFKAVSWPYREAMKAAYSATDANLFVVLPKADTPKSSADGGETWRDSTGVDGSAIKNFWHWQHPLAADRVLGKTFYLYVDGRFYVSEDGGQAWTKTADLPSSQTVFVESAEGHSGWVFVGLGGQGLFMSRNGGHSFERVYKVREAELFSLGRPAPYSDRPTLFVYGSVDGSERHEILRSDDLGMNWTVISVPGMPIGNQPSVMNGDYQTYGRVFIGTNGRGIYVGTRK